MTYRWFSRQVFSMFYLKLMLLVCKWLMVEAVWQKHTCYKHTHANILTGSPACFLSRKVQFKKNKNKKKSYFSCTLFFTLCRHKEEILQNSHYFFSCFSICDHHMQKQLKVCLQIRKKEKSVSFKMYQWLMSLFCWRL